MAEDEFLCGICKECWARKDPRILSSQRSLSLAYLNEHYESESHLACRLCAKVFKIDSRIASLPKTCSHNVSHQQTLLDVIIPETTRSKVNGETNWSNKRDDTDDDYFLDLCDEYENEIQSDNMLYNIKDEIYNKYEVKYKDKNKIHLLQKRPYQFDGQHNYHKQINHDDDFYNFYNEHDIEYQTDGEDNYCDYLYNQPNSEYQSDEEDNHSDYLYYILHPQSEDENTSDWFNEKDYYDDFHSHNGDEKNNNNWFNERKDFCDEKNIEFEEEIAVVDDSNNFNCDYDFDDQSNEREYDYDNLFDGYENGKFYNSSWDCTDYDSSNLYERQEDEKSCNSFWSYAELDSDYHFSSYEENWDGFLSYDSEDVYHE